MSVLDTLIFGYRNVKNALGALLPNQNTLTFQGAGATVADDPANKQTVVTVTGGGGPYGPVVAPPASATFAWVNQVSATAADTVGSSGFDVGTIGDNVDDLHCRVLTAPATPYTLTIGMTVDVQPGSSYRAGVVWRESGTGKIIFMGIDTSTSASMGIEIWTAATGGGAVYPAGSQSQAYNADQWVRGPMWLRMKSDGTLLTWTWSQSGVNFMSPTMTAGSGPIVIAKNDFFTVGPNQVGVAVGATLLAPTFPIAQMHVFHWLVTSP